MVIDQVHGLQATGMSLNDRFTMLAAAPVAPPRPRTPRRRPSTGAFFNENMNRNLIEQIARRLEQQAKRQALRQRLGVGAGGLRRFGSESSLPGLRWTNSFGDLSQRGVKSRITWRQSNGNLNRSASFGNLAGAAWRARGPRRRGGPRGLRGRLRGGVSFGRINRLGARNLRGRSVTRGRGRGRGQPARGAGAGGARRGRGGAGGGGGLPRGAARGRGRGGIMRNQNKVVPTKEELDLQLDQYMAGTKTALDKELDTYMKNAMELE